DGIKLVAKEDITPKDADPLLFKLAPYVSFASSFTAYMALPFANGWAAQNINVGVFFIIAVLGLEVFGVILAGYASGSKWSPFDLAEAESELVAGFHTEYSGLRWSFFFMAEYGSMFLVSGLAAILFFGGWNGPIPIFHMIGWAYEQGKTDYTSTELFLGYLAQ